MTKVAFRFVAEITAGDLVLPNGVASGDSVGTNPIIVAEDRVGNGLDTSWPISSARRSSANRHSEYGVDVGC